MVNHAESSTCFSFFLELLVIDTESLRCSNATNEECVQIGLVEEIVTTSLPTVSIEETMVATTTAPCFVAVHIGAGFHSHSKTGAYRALCDKICQEVLALLKKGWNARKAVSKAVALLEVILI